MNSKQIRSNIALSRKHETHVAEVLREVYSDSRITRPDGGVKVQVGSGNQATAPNDVLVLGKCYVECKETLAASMSVKYAWLEKLKRSAQQGGLRSILALRFTGRMFADYYVVDEATLTHLLQCEREVEARS